MLRKAQHEEPALALAARGPRVVEDARGDAPRLEAVERRLAARVHHQLPNKLVGRAAEEVARAHIGWGRAAAPQRHHVLDAAAAATAWRTGSGPGANSGQAGLSAEGGRVGVKTSWITADVSDFINLIKKFIPLSDIGIKDNPLSVVDEILGNEPSKTFKKFKYTSLEDGIKRTIDFY